MQKKRFTMLRQLITTTIAVTSLLPSTVPSQAQETASSKKYAACVFNATSGVLFDSDGVKGDQNERAVMEECMSLSEREAFFYAEGHAKHAAKVGGWVNKKSVNPERVCRWSAALYQFPQFWTSQIMYPVSLEKKYQACINSHFRVRHQDLMFYFRALRQRLIDPTSK